MNIDFNKLRTFLTVAEQGSVTKAAAILHLTQQAVSHQVSTLEDDLGISLFIRANRQIHLTPEGWKVLATAKKPMLEMEAELLGLKQTTDTLRGRVSIGCIAETAREFILPRVVEFKKIHPKLNFDFHFDVDRVTEVSVLEGKIDLGVVIFNSYGNHLVGAKLLQVPYVAVTSPGLQQKLGKISQFKHLIDYPFVDFLVSAPSFRPWVKKNNSGVFNKIVHRTPEVSVPDELAVKQMILDGIGLGVVPKYLVVDEIRTQKLLEVLPGSKKVTASFEAIALKNRRLPLAVAEFLKFLTLPS